MSIWVETKSASGVDQRGPENHMKKLILAAALLALGATQVSAQYGGPPPGPPGPPGRYAPQPPHREPDWRHAQSRGWCEEKARRLHDFESRMTRDGRVSRDERRIAENLREDLRHSCGGGRWHPNRGWHY